MSKVITVSGNSGKSVFSYFLTMELTKRKHKTALVSTDSQKPMYKLLFPTAKQAEGHSLGRLLSLAVVTESDIFDNAQIIKKDFLMFSYADGESCLSYPEITSTNLNNLYEQLSPLVDYIVVDTSTARNDIDNFFISRSTDICITTADAKGLAYREYYKPQGLQLVLQNSKYNALADVMATFKKPVPVIPHCKSLTAVYNGIDISDIIPSGRYKKIVRNAVNEHAPALRAERV